MPHPAQRLTDTQVEEIRQLMAGGLSLRGAGVVYGISHVALRKRLLRNEKVTAPSVVTSAVPGNLTPPARRLPARVTTPPPVAVPEVVEEVPYEEADPLEEFLVGLNRYEAHSFRTYVDLISSRRMEAGDWMAAKRESRILYERLQKYGASLGGEG